MEMEEKVLTLRKKWSEFQKTEDRTEKKLTFKYGHLGHEKMIQAVLFWKFIRGHLTTEELRKNGLAETIQEFWKLRRLFLSGFVANRNTFVTIIAMIESFSTNLWRKILWKGNLDFVSFESFLRRLEEKQMRVITEAFISIEKDIAFDKSFDEEKRYSSKSKWSYNLLGLDFGFNAYPKGEADDTKVVEVSPLRFLSEKDHANDFVVQQEEDGKYWWLYKKARSNYVLHPNREVELKTHICPGFWYTLFVHFFFWLASPVACAFFIAMALSGHFDKSFLAFLPVAAITPLWLLAAGAKALVNSVFLERTWDRCADVASWAFLAGVIAGGVLVFAWLAINFYYFLVENHIDILMTLALLSVPAVFIAYCVYCKSKYDSGEKVNNMLEFCFKIYVTAACIFVVYRAIKLYHEFFWKIIVLAAYFIAAISVKIWAFLADPLFLMMVVPLVILALFFCISRIVFLYNPVYVEYSKLNFSQKRLPIKNLMKNKWLCSLPPDKRENRIKMLQEFFGRLFYTDNCFRYSYLLPGIDERSFTVLEYTMTSFARWAKWERFGPPEDLLEKIIFKGLSFEDAEKELLRELDLKREAAEKRWKALRKIFSPFSLLWDVVEKAAEYSKTLYRLYELFNKRCPYVAKSKPLGN